MENFGKFCIGSMLIFVSCIFEGFVFMKFWEWFIVYAFDVSPINLIQSIGVLMIVYFTRRNKKEDEKFTFELFVKKIGGAILKNSTALLLGYIITLFQ